MPKARSLHIGLNFVDPDAYDGWDGQLAGCVNDANDMQALCARLGYETRKLIDSDATAHAVVRAIGEVAQELEEGDIFVLTYSGHGSQVPDATSDEPDGKDETWVLWDRMLIDDELHSLWSAFRVGVRIFLLSDSCHSGTVARMRGFRAMCAEADAMREKSRARPSAERALPGRYRLAPPEVAQRAFGPEYEARQWITSARPAPIGATVILISGCQDNQLSLDGAVNGLFTETLKRVWADGAFSGTYKSFWKRILEDMPANQTPNYSVVGSPHPVFEAQRPFSVAPGAPEGDPVVEPPPEAEEYEDPTSGADGSHDDSPAVEAEGRRTLRRGDMGPEVETLQSCLLDHGYHLDVDGVFGPMTESLVRSFQSEHGLNPDGIVGPNTWAELIATRGAPELRPNRAPIARGTTRSGELSRS